MNTWATHAFDTLTQRWRRWISVEGVEDERTAQRGTILNALMAVSVLMGVLVGAVAVIAGREGYLTGAGDVRMSLLFPAVFLLISMVSFSLSKRGKVVVASRLYVWSSFVLIAGGAALLGGVRSTSWFLLFWPVTLAGTLLRPRDAVHSALLSLVWYGVVALAERNGLYVPLVSANPESFRFLGLSFMWIMLITSAGLVNFVNLQSLRGTVEELEETGQALNQARDEMESQVVARTEALNAQAEQFRAIAELSRTTAGIRDLQRLLDASVSLIAERLDFYHVGLFLLDPKGEWAVLRAVSSEEGQRMLARNHRLRVGQEGVVGYVAEVGVPRFASDVGEDRVWFSNPDLPETRSEIGLPLIASGQVIGVLDIQTRRPAAFDDAYMERLRVLAGSIAVAIENVRLFEETQEALTRLERYQEEDAVVAWRQALARRDMSLRYSYASGMIREEEGEGEEAESPPESVTQEPSGDGHYRLTAPVRVGGRHLGSLTFERSDPWSDEAIDLVESVIAQLDLALNNARLLEQTRLQANREAARGEIVGRMRALNSTDAILRSAAEELGRALQVQRSRIQLVSFEDSE